MTVQWNELETAVYKMPTIFCVGHNVAIVPETTLPSFLKKNVSENTRFLWKWNEFENVVCKMSATLSRSSSSTFPEIGFRSRLSQCVNYIRFNEKQVHLFMQEHEKRKPWLVIMPSKYQLTIIYTKCLLSLSHWDESILLSYHICIKPNN